MNAVEECPDNPAFNAWTDAEAAFESFIARYTDFDVRRMNVQDFTQWKRDYLRLYLDVWRAQMAYYQALRGQP
jgi:hypothetical protein